MVDRSSRIKLSNGQIFWRESGDSNYPVLVFLHGSWHDRDQWQEMMVPLSENFHCLAIDLLGFGNSLATQPPTSIASEVECLNEFLNALKLTRPVYLVGHSLGAWIAIDYALKYPARTQGIVAISPEGFLLPTSQQYGFLTKILLAHPLLFKLWLGGLKILAAMSDGATPLEQTQAYWEFLNKFPTTHKLLFQRSNKAIVSELVADKLAQFKAPILILQSDSDDAAVIQQSQSYAQAIRNAQYRSIQTVEPISPAQSLQQTIGEIQVFVERIQLKVDREEVEVW